MATSKAQKLLNISLFLFQSICGALFFTRLALTFSLASAAVGLRDKPLSSNGSFFSMSPSCMEKGAKMSASHHHHHSMAAVFCSVSAHMPQERCFCSTDHEQTLGVGYFGAGQSPSSMLCLWFQWRQQHPCGHGVNYDIVPCGLFSFPHLKNAWKWKSRNIEAAARGKRSCSACLLG